jgi:succinate dehydrogenase hydrophobic anchor subunit
MMIETPSVPKTREGTWLWLYKIVAGLLIVILLGVHFVVNHLVAPNGLLSYDDVIRYYQVPIIPIMEIAFLAFVVSHALVGLRSIILDLNPSNLVLKIVDILFVLVGTGFVAYGIWLVVVIAQK